MILLRFMSHGIQIQIHSTLLSIYSESGSHQKTQYLPDIKEDQSAKCVKCISLSFSRSFSRSFSLLLSLFLYLSLSSSLSLRELRSFWFRPENPVGFTPSLRVPSSSSSCWWWLGWTGDHFYTLSLSYLGTNGCMQNKSICIHICCECCECSTLSVVCT